MNETPPALSLTFSPRRDGARADHNVSLPFSRDLESSPAPAGVYHLSLEPERRIGQRRGHHGNVTARCLVPAAQLVDHLQRRDPPPRPWRSSPHHLSRRLVAYLLQTRALEQHRQLLAKHLVVAARSPPVAVSPDPLVVVVARVRGIDGRGRPPIAVLIEQPATGAQALRHSADRL